MNHSSDQTAAVGLPVAADGTTLGHSLLRYGYFPFQFLGVNGLACAFIAADYPPVATLVAVLAMVAVALAVSFAAERLLPYDPDWNLNHNDTLRDRIHFAVNEAMSMGPLIVLPVLAGAGSLALGNETLWPSSLPWPVQLAGALVIFDLGQNLFHRFAHRWEPLWRLHAVHHSVRRMYGLNGVLKHPIYQGLSAVVSLAPLVALGMPHRIAMMISFCSFMQLLLQHANVDYRTGVLRRVLANAEVHRFHHLRGEAGDVNFSLFFSAWDHLLGTAFDEERKLSSGDIGVDYADYPDDYLGQLVAPLRRYEVVVEEDGAIH